MTKVSPTSHALLRMAQRGIAIDDIELIMLLGTEVEGGYLVREKDCQAFEQQIKHILQKAKRLTGKRVVIEGGRVVTAYRAAGSKTRRLLRRAEEASLRRSAA